MNGSKFYAPATLTNATATLTQPTATLTHAPATPTHATAGDFSSSPISLVKLAFSGYDPGGLLVSFTMMDTLVVEQSYCHRLCLGVNY